MIIINNVSAKYFSLNGVNFAKIYQPLKQGETGIGIYNIYDTRQQLVSSTKFEEFSINGVTGLSVEGTVALLLDVVFDSRVSSLVFELEGKTSKGGSELTAKQLDDKIGIAASGSPRGVYADLAALNAANPDGNFTYITSDNNSWNYFDGTEFVLGGDYLVGGSLMPSDVVNDLNSTEISKPLSANQGRVLNESINEVVNEIETGGGKFIENVFAEKPSNFGYVGVDGNVQGEGTDENWLHTGLLRVEVGTEIGYSGTQTPNNVSQVAFYDINEVFVSGIVGGTDGVVSVPSGVTFVRFCANALGSLTSVVSFTESVGLKEGLALKIDIADIVDGINSTEISKPLSANQGRVLNEKINEASSESFEFENITEEIVAVYGYVRSPDGEVQGDGTDSNWLHSDFFYSKKGGVVEYSGTDTPDNVFQVSFYDEYKNLISGVVGGSNGSVSVPSVAVFERYCWQSSAAPIISTVILRKIIDLIDEKISITDINDTLTSTSSEVPASANVARVLNEKIIEIQNLAETKPAKNYKYDVNHFVHYGQSLSQGDWADSIVSNVQPYNSLMFTGGIRVWENRNQATIYNALVPAVENVFAYEVGETVVGASVRGETPSCGTADKIVELIRDEDGFDFDSQQYQILVSACGMGGTGILTLSDKGNIYYQRLLADVTNGKALSNAAGKTYGVPVVSWIQGEADTYGDMTEAAYYNNMVTLFTDLNTDIKVITGQEEDVQFLLYQTQAFDWYYGGKFTYPDVSLAQLRIANEVENVHLATPIYHLPHIPNDCHFTPVGSKWFGGYFGIAYKRIIIDKKPFSCITPKSFEVVGNNIYIKFHAPVFPLKFDVVNVVDRGVSKGFQIRNVNDRSQNSFLDIITNVEINKFDTVKITCSSSPAGKKLTYAINGTSASDTSSGNLRDSQDIQFSFPEVIGGASVEHEMFNFCPLFEILL